MALGLHHADEFGHGDAGLARDHLGNQLVIDPWVKTPWIIAGDTNHIPVVHADDARFFELAW